MTRPESTSSSQHKGSRHHPYSKKPRRHENEDALPGVQKLKSALRQTNRLLAKDNLTADVRVETQRRLKALEADLARAEQTQKERHYATKYHKVKFFERKKVVRKLNQTKRSITTAQGKEKEELEAALADLRVDLNYTLHFPKDQKYVSLFPPEVRNSSSAATPVAASSDDNRKRSKVRQMIRQQMERGELSAEPDELWESDQEAARIVSSRRRVGTAPSIKPRAPTDDVAHDDFFGNEDEEDSQQSEASDS